MAEVEAHSKSVGNNADQEKQQMASVLVAPEDSFDPYGAAEVPGVRHLGESSHSLSVSDFELLKTLGTGI
jgi:hypothetical protein